MTPHDRILAFTPTYGNRRHIRETIAAMRATAGTWVDWLVVAGAPSLDLANDLQALLHDPAGHGIQYLKIFPENRGQHWATRVALEIARANSYPWLLRIDDDIQPKTKGWLRGSLIPDVRGLPRTGMLDRLEWLREASGDPEFRLVASPRVVGLNSPLEPSAVLEKPGQAFRAEMMPILGGACRLHPLRLLDGFEPDIYAPRGRTDPEQLGQHLLSRQGIYVRFPDITVRHPTDELESRDTLEESEQRQQGKVWPWLESSEV